MIVFFFVCLILPKREPKRLGGCVLWLSIKFGNANFASNINEKFKKGNKTQKNITILSFNNFFSNSPTTIFPSIFFFLFQIWIRFSSSTTLQIVSMHATLVLTYFIKTKVSVETEQQLDFVIKVLLHKQFFFVKLPSNFSH